VQPAKNVVKFSDDIVYDDIQSYFNELDIHKREGEKHSKTRVSYEGSIRQFFKETRGKDIEHLTVVDLKYKKNDITNYRKHLQDKFGYSNSTINQKITAIKCLFEELKSVEYDVNTSIFKIKRLKSIPNSYGSLSQTEAERFAQTALETEVKFPKMKYLLIMFAIRTSFRLDEILNVTWDDFEFHNGVYKVKTIGKGTKENTNAIHPKLYDQILELKETNSDKNNKVFQISEVSINHMMSRLRKKLNISEERNIVFHSFRGVAIDFELETTGDIKKAAQQGNHSNITTTYNSYINKTKDYTQLPGVKMDEEIDWSFMDQMSLEEFKEFFKQSNQYKLYIDLKKFKGIS
jgi:integrase